MSARLILSVHVQQAKFIWVVMVLFLLRLNNYKHSLSLDLLFVNNKIQIF